MFSYFCFLCMDASLYVWKRSTWMNTDPGKERSERVTIESSFQLLTRHFKKQQRHKVPTSHQNLYILRLTHGRFFDLNILDSARSQETGGEINILFNRYFFSIHIACQPAPTKSKALGQNYLRKMLWVRWGGCKIDFFSNENCCGLTWSLISFIPSLIKEIPHEAQDIQ